MDEKDPAYLKQLKKLLSDEEKTINISMAAFSGTGHSIQGNINVNMTGVEVVVPPPPPVKQIPDVWHVPPKNPHFVGRCELLKQVAAHLSQDNQQLVLTACHGLGGIGKTQVAVEFVWRHYQSYKGVFWFNAESKGRLQEEYINLGCELDILQEEKISAEVQARYVKQWLEQTSRSGWLLIYDNAPEYGGQEGIGELIPVKQGKVLVTSRYATGWPQARIEVDMFTPEESRAYIKKRLGYSLSEDDSALIDRLADTLSHLPLALAQAGAYIQKNQLSIRRYLELYETRKKALLADITLSKETLPPDSQRAIVYIIWDITMEKIRSESLLAAHWLNSCACLASNDIPDFLLEAFAKDPRNNPTSQIYDEARGILSSYSMLTVDKQSHSVSIHRLLQEVIRLKWEAMEKMSILFATWHLLMDSYPCYRKTMADFAQKRQLLPHLEAFLGHLDAWQQEVAEVSPVLGQTIEQDLIDNFLTLMCEGYNDLGDAQKGRDVLERALAINEKHYSPDHPKMVIILMNLGTMYGALGDNQKARDLLESTLPLIESHYGSDHPKVANSLVNLSNAYRDLGDTQKARGLLERALAILNGHYGPDHPDVAQTSRNLGLVYMALGDDQKAQNILEHALLVLEKHYGPDHPDVMCTSTNLGAVYAKLGHTEKGCKEFERLLPLLEKHYRPEHPVMASALTNLGCAYMTLGHTEKACEVLEPALPLLERHYGPDHHNVAFSLTNLSTANAKLGHNEKACEELERALPLLERHYGPDHHNVAGALMNLGVVYVRLGHFEKSRKVLERALLLLERHYGPDHHNVARALTILGLMHMGLGDVQKAQDMLEHALTVFERYYGPDHLYVAGALKNLGVLYVKLGHTEKACEVLKQALTLLERHYGPDHPDVLNTLKELCKAYVALELTPEKIAQLRALQTFEDETRNKNYKYFLQKHDIADIARIEYGYITDGKNLIFMIIASPDQLKNTLKDFEKKTRQENEQRFLALVINQGQGHWVTLIITYQNGQLYAYYCDSLGNELPSETKYTLISVMPEDHIQDFKVKQHDAVYDSGFMALENAHTIHQLTEAVFLSLFSSDVPVDKGLTPAVKQQLFDQIRAELLQHQPTLAAMKKTRDDWADKLFNDEKRTHLKTLNAIEQNWEEFKVSLNKGVDIDDTLYGYTLLHLAAKEGRLSLVQNLLAQGAIFNAVVYQEGDKTPLDMARQYSHQDLIELLNSVNSLFNAIKDGQPQKVVADLSHVTDPDKIVAITSSYERGGRTLLHYATQEGCLEVVESLLQQKVKVDPVAKNKSLWTPLHYAAKLNHVSIVQALLKRGASYAPQDNQGRTPRQLTTDSTIRSVLEATDKLFQAVKEDSLTELMSALDQGAEINAHDREGRTILHVAAQRDYTMIVKALLQTNIEINARDDHRWTPLHLAARKSQRAVVQLLLEKGADVLAMNDHDSVLHQAVRGQDIAIIRLILEAIQEKFANDPRALDQHRNVEDTEGDTPLMWAAELGNVKAAQQLLDYGVDINAKNKAGLTALHSSIQENHLDMAIFLLEHKDTKLSVDQRCGIINNLIEHRSCEMRDVLITMLLPSD